MPQQTQTSFLYMTFFSYTQTDRRIECEEEKIVRAYRLYLPFTSIHSRSSHVNANATRQNNLNNSKKNKINRAKQSKKFKLSVKFIFRFFTRKRELHEVAKVH